ncbi:MAG: acyltransferase, partial [Gammaproteobacteria bacterium]|nr:acyltransferase [Gammaproteobacteria bacterium]
MLTDKKLAFRHGLQGLRAVAILLVILAHSGLAIVQGGFIGVDVFFVLSGYLITGLLLCELEISGRISIMSFYARRLKRLLPALIFMLSISFGSAVWILSEVEARAQLASSQFAATWTSNLYFAFTK